MKVYKVVSRGYEGGLWSQWMALPGYRRRYDGGRVVRRSWAYSSIDLSEMCLGDTDEVWLAECDKADKILFVPDHTSCLAVKNASRNPRIMLQPTYSNISSREPMILLCCNLRLVKYIGTRRETLERYNGCLPSVSEF